jgi:hypothetical protein
MSRGRTWVGLMVLVVAAALLGASSASASGVACASCSGTYMGTWSAQDQYSTPEGTQTASLSLTWTETLTTPTGSANGVWSLTSAQGTISFTNSGSSSDDCTASLIPDLAVAGDITEFAPQVIEGSSVAVGAAPPTYWSGSPTEPLVSSDDSHPGCDFTNELAYEGGFWTKFTGPDCHYSGQSVSEVMSVPVGGPPTTVADNCDAEGSDVFGRMGTATLTSQLTLTVPGPCGAAGAADLRGGLAFGAAAAAQACCANALEKPIYAGSDGGVFDGATPLRLSTSQPNGGCPPFKWRWQLTAGAPKGLKFSTTGGFTSKPNLVVAATCPGAKGKKGKALNAALRACIGPVDFSVQAIDSIGQTTDIVHTINNWCVPGAKGKPDRCTPQLSKKLKTEFLDQAAQYARQGLAKLWDEGLAILGETLTTPSGGLGKVGKVKDYYDSAANGKRVHDATKDDADLADKARQAAADDPPAGNLSAISLPHLAAPRLAPCGHPVGAPAGVAAADCAALAPDFAALAAAQARTSAVLDAVLTSQNRYATAAKAGDATDSALQHDVSGILYVELGDAFAAGDSAELALIRAGRTQGLIPILARSRIQSVAAAVAKLHSVPTSIVQAVGPISLAQLRSLIDGALADAAGGKLDVLGTFPPPFSAASLIPPSGWVTDGELRAVIAQLVSQGAVPAATATALGGVLDSLLEASTPASAAQGLSQLTADAGQVPGEAGAFLKAAALALTT